MSIKSLAEKVKGFKGLVNEAITGASHEIDEASRLLKEAGGAAPEKKKLVKPAKNGKVNLAEGAPLGSFEYIRQEIYEALEKQKIFGDRYCYLLYVYPETVIVSCADDYFQIGYQMDMDGKLSFGEPVQVEQFFAPSEASVSESGRKIPPVKGKTLATELKESQIEITKKAEQMDYCFDEFHSLKEAKYDDATGELEVVIIEAGTNELKMRHYPVSTIQEAAPCFSGMKMYINHQTKAEEAARPERDLRDWAATIVESWADGSKAMGKVVIHNEWLRESMKNPVFRSNIGLSINAGGKVSYGKINGKEMQIVEKIIPARSNGPASVDWVTEAGARGRVSRLLESQTKEGTSMELKEAKFADLKRENPELLSQITESVIASIKESDETKAKDKELKEKNEKLAALELKEKQTVQSDRIDAILKEAKTLPELSKSRIKKSLMTSLIEEEAKLKEAVAEAVKEELAYVNTFSKKGKITLAENGAKGSTAGDKSALAQHTDELSESMGLTKKDAEEGEEK